MIAKLSGIIDIIEEDYIIVNVGGVGYQVFCSAKTLSSLPDISEMVVLNIITHVREDHINLYGFFSLKEKHCFELITRVQGVGNKLALTILSVMDPNELFDAISLQDKSQFLKVTGVGSKLASRIVSELNDKLEIISKYMVDKDNVSTSALSLKEKSPLFDDAVSALINLGYSHQDIVPILRKIIRSDEKLSSLQVLIRYALRDLSSDG